jgi:transcriptional regulator with XRE-family HTH domain
MFLYNIFVGGEFVKIDFMVAFSKRFKQLRVEKGFTQEELLTDFNKRYNRSYRATAISYYENRKRVPEISALFDFADYFGVSISYLLGDSNVRDPDVNQATGQLPESVLSNEERTKKEESRQENELLDAFRSLSPAGKATAVNQVIALIEVFPANIKEGEKEKTHIYPHGLEM